MSAPTPYGILLTCFVGEFPEGHWQHVNRLRHLYLTRYEPLRGDQDDAYGKTLNHVWRMCGSEKRDLLIVEPDIWPEQSHMDGMVKCDDLYCTSPYWLGAVHGTGLGFTRFRWQLSREHPDLVSLAAFRTEGTGPVNSEPWHWRRMDWRINDALVKEHGIHPCKHDPVRHTHLYPAKDPLFS